MSDWGSYLVGSFAKSWVSGASIMVDFARMDWTGWNGLGWTAHLDEWTGEGRRAVAVVVVVV